MVRPWPITHKSNCPSNFYSAPESIKNFPSRASTKCSQVPRVVFTSQLTIRLEIHFYKSLSLSSAKLHPWWLNARLIIFTLFEYDHKLRRARCSLWILNARCSSFYTQRARTVSRGSQKRDLI